MTDVTSDPADAVDEPLVLCCLLWAREARTAELSAYEDRVLAMLGDHRGALLLRLVTEGGDGRPDEIRVLRFPDRDAFESFVADPRRAALAVERQRVVARTELFPASVRPA